MSALTVIPATQQNWSDWFRKAIVHGWEPTKKEWIRFLAWRSRRVPSVTIEPVDSRGQQRRFIDLPWRLYADDPCWVHTDASAAKGIASRRGLGKVRHIEVSQLWLQEKVMRGEIKVIKVKGTENLSDSLTKYVNRDDIDMHMNGTSQVFKAGRHDLMPHVAQ